MAIYRLEYAKLGTSKCKGPKPCNGSPIPKGSLRCGTVVDIQGRTSFAWRHWGCMTKKQFENMKADFNSAEDLDGYEDLREEDQARVATAFEAGEVADEDIPDSARKPPASEGEDEEVEEDEKGAKTGGSSKKKAPAKPKAKKAAAPKKKSKKAAESDGEEEEAEAQETASEEEKPKSKAKKGTKRAAKEEDDTPVEPRARSGRNAGKPAKSFAESGSDDEEEEKKPRSKKAKKSKAEVSDEDE